jgi:hypothetical protein
MFGAKGGVEVRPVRGSALDGATPLGEERARQRRECGSRADRRVQQFAAAQPMHELILHLSAVARHGVQAQEAPNAHHEDGLEVDQVVT